MTSSEVNNKISELAAQKDELGLTWDDISNEIYRQFGMLISGDACRKRAHKNVTIDDTPIKDVVEDQNDNLNSDMLISYQLKDERTQITSLFRRMSREENIKDIAREVAGCMNDFRPISINKVYVKNTPCNEALFIISDWHYGIDINNYVNVYNTDICKQRVVDITSQVVNKIKQNKITKLHILNLGDMIAGIIHLQLRINSRIDVMTQVIEVSEIIANMIADLAKYVDIEYYSVLDNHSRLDPNKKESMNLESLARITHWYLKERFKDSKSVNINDNEIDQDIASFYIKNEFLVVGVHGDKDKQCNMIPSLNLFTKENIDMVCSAHLHHFSANEDNRVWRVSNGSLMGTDDFAFQKRLDSVPSQTLVTFNDTEYGLKVDGVYKLESQIFS